jgi:hypothetical protein
MKEVDSMGVCFSGFDSSKIWELVDSDAILGVSPQALEAMTAEQFQVIPEKILKKIPNGMAMKKRKS